MDRYRIPNLAKACGVLALLAPRRTGLTPSEVARQLSMPRTTAFRVLRTLCGEGLLEESEGRYRAGPGLLRLGLMAVEAAELPARAEPVLSYLAQQTGETAHLAIRAGDRMLIAAVCDSPNPIRVASRPGTLVLMHCAATGKAVLAGMSSEAVRALLPGPKFERRTDRTLTTPAALERELEPIRRQGYALDDGEYHDGVRCLAATVFNARGEATAAIGITAAATRFTKRRIASVARDVKHAAEALSAAMGRTSTGGAEPARAGLRETRDVFGSKPVFEE